MRVKFLLYSVERAKNINRRFLWIGRCLNKFFFNTKANLAKAELGIGHEQYLTACFFSAMVYGLIFFLFFNGLLAFRDGFVLYEDNFFFSSMIGLAFFLIFLVLHTIYPGIISKNIASDIDNSLLFALKSIMIQVTSGISLFNSMKNISKANYGLVSKEFGEVVKDVSSGMPEKKALEKMAFRTRSDYLKKMTWQLINSLKSGASLIGALTSIVASLTQSQIRAIKNYAAELNMWILMYLMIAAAVPTIGLVFLIILSSLGGASVEPLTVWLMVGFSFAVQAMMIGFVSKRVPKVFL